MWMKWFNVTSYEINKSECKLCFRLCALKLVWKLFMEYVLIHLSDPEKKWNQHAHIQTRASQGVLSPCDMTNHGEEWGGDAYTQESRNKAYALGGGWRLHKINTSSNMLSYLKANLYIIHNKVRLKISPYLHNVLEIQTILKS